MATTEQAIASEVKAESQSLRMMADDLTPKLGRMREVLRAQSAAALEADTLAAARASGEINVANKPVGITRTAEDINFFKEEDLSLRTDWMPGKRAGRTPYQNSVRHWVDHAEEFPELNSYNDYFDATYNFLLEPPLGTQSFVRSGGDIMRFNPGTNTFGVLRADGVPRTMFRPDIPSYWELQLKKWGGGQ